MGAATPIELGESERNLLKSIGPALWNLGSSCKYVRAKKLFGWDPKELPLEKEIAQVVKSEALALGLGNSK
jgi:hypothetical protein